VGGKSIRIEDFLQSHVILGLTRSDQKPAPRVNFDVGNFRVQRTGHPHHGQSVGLKLFLIKASTSMARMSWPVLASPSSPRIPLAPRESGLVYSPGRALKCFPWQRLANVCGHRSPGLFTSPVCSTHSPTFAGHTGWYNERPPGGLTCIERNLIITSVTNFRFRANGWGGKYAKWPKRLCRKCCTN